MKQHFLNFGLVAILVLSFEALAQLHENMAGSAKLFAPAPQSVRLPLQLSAGVFFEPLREGTKRDPSWPEKLTVTSVRMSIDDVRQKLEGQWLLAYHCAGKPMTYSLFRKQELFVPESAVNFVFDGKVVTRKLYIDGQERGTEASRGKITFQQSVSKANTYQVVDIGAGVYEVRFEAINNVRPFETVKLRPARIEETGELVFEIDLKGKDRECGIHTPTRSIFVPMPLLS